MSQQIPGTKLAERLWTRPGGATMTEIIAATGGPKYNHLRRLKAQGFRVREVREGKEKRYFLTPPERPTFEATITSKGQVTIPKEVREALKLRNGQKLSFVLEDSRRAVVTPTYRGLGDLAGILPKPKRTVTVEEMDEAIAHGAVGRFRRAVGNTR